MRGIFFNEFNSSYIPHILQELYIEKVYDPFFKGKKDMTILDVGGNIGLFSFYAHEHAKKIYCLEPSKQHVEVIKHMLDYNSMSDRVEVLQLALSNKNGSSKFYHNQNKTMFSLQGAVSDGSETEEVKTITLDALMIMKGIKKVDFMKLDIEGSEFDVISSKGFELVSDKIDSMVVEIHQWAGRNPSQITTALRDYGFDVWNIPAQATLFGARRRK